MNSVNEIHEDRSPCARRLLVSQKISLYHNVFSCKEGRRGERESRREGERNRGEGRRGERKK